MRKKGEINLRILLVVVISVVVLIVILGFLTGYLNPDKFGNIIMGQLNQIGNIFSSGKVLVGG